VIKTVMLNETVDGEFTTTDDVADAVLFFAGASTNAMTGQSLVVSQWLVLCNKGSRFAYKAGGW